MSTLNVGTIKSLGSSAPVFQNSSGVEKGQLAKAWVNINGTGTVAIRGSFNVSSITDNAVGDYSVTMTTAMANANYAVVGSAGVSNAFLTFMTNTRSAGATLVQDPTTTVFRFVTAFGGSNTNRQDPNHIAVAAFGD